MANISSTDPTFRSKRKAIISLLPYAVRLARNEQREMMDAILHVALNPRCWGFTWRRIGPYITTLFDKSSPPYLNQVTTLVAPSIHWGDGTYTQHAVARWIAAVLATPYSEVVGQNVVDALLQIVCEDTLRQEIPIEIWAWLKKRPSLPPVCRGRAAGTKSAVVHHIRGLGDIEILKSYFLLVWSEWDYLHDCGLTEMMITIGEEFRGIAMRHHRDDLTERLDYILGQLDQGVWDSKEHVLRVFEYGKEQYRQLKEVLLEVDRSSREASPRTPPMLIFFKSILTLVGVYRNLTKFLAPALDTQTLLHCHPLDLWCITFLTFLYFVEMPCSTICTQRGTIIDGFFTMVIGGVQNSFLLVHDTVGGPIVGKQTSQ